MIVRLATLAVLAVIGQDLVDSTCFDCDLARVSAPVVSSAAGAGGDACADGCLPDCFCCATPAPAVTLVLTQGLAVLDRPPTAPGRWVASGFPLVPEHIPIHVA